ncbi:MAG: XRE family transcriptional regulator [Acidimicrobiia bacterium]|nr:XRE family transcriptional regulator [Acidimicrobiia bacterium]
MKNIARYRNERALTQGELASIVGVSRRTLARWESGKVKPRPNHLVALADALGCDVIELEAIETLKDARRAAGYSQRAFAEVTGIPPGSLAHIETGRAPIPDPSLWARILGRTTVDIQKLASGAIEARYHLLIEG